MATGASRTVGARRGIRGDLGTLTCARHRPSVTGRRDGLLSGGVGRLNRPTDRATGDVPRRASRTPKHLAAPPLEQGVVDRDHDRRILVEQTPHDEPGGSRPQPVDIPAGASPHPPHPSCACATQATSTAARSPSTSTATRPTPKPNSRPASDPAPAPPKTASTTPSSSTPSPARSPTGRPPGHSRPRNTSCPHSAQHHTALRPARIGQTPHWSRSRKPIRLRTP
jgi:hypothetical protein